MSFFGKEKDILMSISAIYATATQTATTSLQTATIFNLRSTTQLISSVGYPSVSVDNSGQITFASGWKYLIDLKMKCNSTNLTAGEYIEYFFTDLASTQISSSGRLVMYRNDAGSAGDSSQEKCLMYVDNTSSSSQALIKFKRVGGASNSTLNGDNAGYNTNSKSYILIKAWK